MTVRNKVVFVLIALGLFYNFFLGDYLQYKEVMDSHSAKAVYEYYRDYPDGWFVEEVNAEEVVITEDIDLARKFLKKWPDSEQLGRIEALRVELWDAEIEYFDTIVAVEHADEHAVEFFRSLLQHMRDHKQFEIYLDLSGQVELTEYSEYPLEIRQLIDAFWKENDGRTVTDNILNLKSNYSEGSIREYERIISAAIEQSFENVLSENFIKVRHVAELAPESEDNLRISIGYLIQNQMIEDMEEFPNVWTYTTDNRFQSYVLAVDIEYDFRFQVPGSESYEFRLRSDPSDAFVGFDHISEAYEIMTKQNFQDFADQIGMNFGLRD